MIHRYLIDGGEQIVSVEGRDGALFIRPEGYGTKTSAAGQGWPIVIERYNGRLRLLVWEDIRDEDPYIIDMETAYETDRKDTH